MESNLSKRIAQVNIVLLIAYSIVFIGGFLRFYEIWISPVTDFLGSLMLFSFYLPPLVEDPGPLTQFMGAAALQWFLPIILAAFGIYLSRKKYLIVHLGLILLIAASLAIIFLRGVNVWNV